MSAPAHVTRAHLWRLLWEYRYRELERDVEDLLQLLEDHPIPACQTCCGSGCGKCRWTGEVEQREVAAGA